MKIFTDAPIYSYAGDNPDKLVPLKPSTLPTSLGAPTTLSTLKESKEAKRKEEREKKKQERIQKKAERKKIREEKRALRRAKRLAKKLLRAKDKTGRKKWFYPISRVFKGKKKQKDGTIVDVASSDIITTKSGAQFDRNEIATATGLPPAQVTSQVVENIVVTNPQPNVQASENTTLTPFIKAPEPAPSENKSVEEVLNSMTTFYAPVNENKEIVQGDDGGMYVADETTSQEEPPISDEEFAKIKKDGKEPKKGLGVWGWVGISAIAIGLGVGAVLIYRMSKK